MPLPFTLQSGDCREVLRILEESSMDVCVTDPPYELGFMGKDWDSRGVSFQRETWAEVLRVLKPGAHLLAFGGTRTHHRIACAIEDAGFEIRDCIQWLYGQGFPKSLDIGKAIDKMMGEEQKVLGPNPNHRPISGIAYEGIYAGGNTGAASITIAAYPEAKKWDGWGTALKPAYEPIIVARKPLAGTVAQNVLEYSTGGLNIDGCRIPTTDNLNGDAYSGGKRNPMPGDTRSSRSAGCYGAEGRLLPDAFANPSGRWPANVVLDEEAAQALDEQTGILKSGKLDTANNSIAIFGSITRGTGKRSTVLEANSGGASRFFYCAKTSSSERNAAGENRHPTLKPIALMRYLIKLATPPGGLVLDPFMGSGSTGVAAILEGDRFVGIDLLPDHVSLAQQRILHYFRRPVSAAAVQEIEVARCY